MWTRKENLAHSTDRHHRHHRHHGHHQERESKRQPQYGCCHKSGHIPQIDTTCLTDTADTTDTRHHICHQGMRPLKCGCYKNFGPIPQTPPAKSQNVKFESHLSTFQSVILRGPILQQHIRWTIILRKSLCRTCNQNF